MPDVFDVLLNHGDPQRAIRYAKKMMEEHGDRQPAKCAPGTKVFELVEELAQYLSEPYREQFFGNRELITGAE